VTTTVEGRERHAVRVRYPRAWREDEESVRELLVPAQGPAGAGQVPLAQVADVRIVEGPATIKSENGLLRNYVRLNVRDRGVGEFVDEARRVVAEEVRLPAGVYLEWTGQFEHELRARRTLLLILPLVVGLIFLVLYVTYRDWADAVLMLLAVPGALAGGVFVQWLFGYKFSVTVWVGYIACFGMATSTGIIMLVYLREAVARAGGLENLTPEQLRQAVLDGAVHRLRPKLLTEGTTILGLAPLLWASGVGAEIIQPMVAPVLGGLLIADEVIDLLLPVLFYRVRRWRQGRRS
jgi:Cu(I)/Ag(I) efflux system membrane protein CusA/SilA